MSPFNKPIQFLWKKDGSKKMTKQVSITIPYGAMA